MVHNFEPGDKVKFCIDNNEFFRNDEFRFKNMNPI